MKKSPPPGGARICMRVLFYATTFIAVLATRETLTDGTGPVSKQLGVIFNETLMAGSKLALGVAVMTDDLSRGDQNGESASTMLGKAAHKAFVSAAKVSLYAN